MYNFDAKKVKDDIINWIREWFEVNGKDCNAVIGISGGIDSSVVAALCVEALGKDKVIGVKMPNGIQHDIGYADLLINHLKIKSFEVNIEHSFNSILTEMKHNSIDITEQTKINLPPRIRMATLYAVSQSNNGRVANTSNLSESYVGYDSRFGDSVGDFSPLFNLTKTEVKAIGKELGLPEALINKTPTDGLCGKTDEENLGITYEKLDKYIREGIIDDIKMQERIEKLHIKNEFKLKPMPYFEFNVD